MEYETVKDYIDAKIQSYRAQIVAAQEGQNYEALYKLSLKIEALENLMLTMPDYLLWFSHK
ncbi:MAG: hypothetical protein ACOC4Y_01365 [bacterium]